MDTGILLWIIVFIKEKDINLEELYFATIIPGQLI
jgi:hypothetical protein